MVQARTNPLFCRFRRLSPRRFPPVFMRHIIAILLQNEAGALTRVAGLFSTRGYNIESLSVAPTDDPTGARLTRATKNSALRIQHIMTQLTKVVDGIHLPVMT